MDDLTVVGARGGRHDGGRPILSSGLKVGVLALGLAACVDVLGVGDFEDAIDALCRCDEQVPQFRGQCRTILRDRLNSVTADRREAWLRFFADNCGEDCSLATQCFQQDATCTSQGRECGESAECCGSSEGLAACEPSTTVCQTAR
ncbi:MAG: hypothetical protein AAGA56_14235 [Myxococcota bacterium]